MSLKQNLNQLTKRINYNKHAQEMVWIPKQPKPSAPPEAAVMAIDPNPSPPVMQLVHERLPVDEFQLIHNRLPREDFQLVHSKLERVKELPRRKRSGIVRPIDGIRYQARKIVYGENNARPGTFKDQYLQMKIPMDLDEKEVKEYVKMFKFNPIMRTGEPHDHAFSAAVRWTAQALMEKNIQLYLSNHNVPVSYCDVYGSARQPDPRKWSCMPLITPGDVLRSRPERCCDCLPEHCSHLRAHSVSFSVDSLYYMNPQQISNICALTRVKQHHVLFHRMISRVGVVNNGEYRWNTFSRDGKLFNHVTIGTKDSANIYQSPVMDWLNQRCWKTSHGYLYYVFKKNYGPMEYGVFMLMDRPLIDNPVHVNQDQIKVISWHLDTPLKNSTLLEKMKDLLKFSIGTLTGIVSRYRLVEYDVPLALYSELVQHALFQPVDKRDNILLELKGRAMRWKKDHVQHGGYIDDSYFLEYLPHVIAAALTVSLPAEFGALHYNYVDDYCVKNKALWRKSYSRAGRVCVSLTAVAAGLAALTYLAPVPMAILVVVTTIVAGACLSLQLGYRKPKYNPSLIYKTSICHMMDFGNYMEFINSIPQVEEDILLPRIPLLTDRTFDGRYKLIGQDEFLAVYKPVIHALDLECGCLDVIERQKNVCQFLHLDGSAVKCYTNCSCNFASAITQRYFRITPHQSFELWNLEASDIIGAACTFIDGRLEVNRHSSEWYNKLPTFKKAAVDKARVLQDTSRYHLSKPSVKLEITVQLESADKAPKPRAFFPKDPLHYLETGPSMYAIKKMLQRSMNGVNTRFLFACGYNPLELGTALKTGLENWLPGSREAYECDLKTCESTMCGYLLALEAEFMARAGVREHVCQSLYGKTVCKENYKNGKMSFTMKNCRESGCSNTSVGNSIVYSTMLKHVLQKYQVHDYFVVVGGDDSVIYFYPEDRDNVRSALESLPLYGLDPELKYRPFAPAARFYSGFFLPVKDKNVEKWVHVPSIGKAFVKSFTYRMKQGLSPYAWLRETMRQKEETWQHIPILGKLPQLVSPILVDHNEKVPRNTKFDCGGFLFEEMKHSKVVASPETWVVLADIYDCTSQEFMECEDRLAHFFKDDWQGKNISDSFLLYLLSKDLE
jgi:hypothetical protein